MQAWLKEGLSLERPHPRPPLPAAAGGDFAKAESTYDRCVDLLNEVPGNRPVAFRMPCCDSLNTLSPRFFAEIFNRTTPKGHFLTIDTSVFNVITANDPDLPRDLVLDPDGRERFRKYLPFTVVRQHDRGLSLSLRHRQALLGVPLRRAERLGGAAPSRATPTRARSSDLKAALDATVLKQGVFNLVFHPHGWIKTEQVVD